MSVRIVPCGLGEVIGDHATLAVARHGASEGTLDESWQPHGLVFNALKATMQWIHALACYSDLDVE